MSIIFDGGRRMFLLHTNETSYVMRISNAGYLCHVYWGKKIRDIHPEEVTVNKFRALSPVTDITDGKFIVGYRAA